MITRKITSIKCCFPVNMPKRLCQNLGPSKKSPETGDKTLVSRLSVFER